MELWLWEWLKAVKRNNTQKHFRSLEPMATVGTKQALKMKPKIALVTFYTEGAPLDNGKDLSASVNSIKNKFASEYDYILALSPSILKQLDESWGDIIHNSDFVDRHLRSQQRDGTLNLSWINLNSLLWKPAILNALLAQDSGIKEGTIILYHDADSQKYPNYDTNLRELGAFVRNRLSSHSILLITDSLFRLHMDCKQEVLRTYLHTEGHTLCHRWAGCIAMKKNSYSREFCRNWLNLTARDYNRDQITAFSSYPGFIWHSQEQSTLSIVYYLWKYGSRKGRHITTEFAPGRKISKNWSPSRQARFFISSARFHLQNYFGARSIGERLIIAIKARSSLKYLNDFERNTPKIRIDRLACVKDAL